MSSKSVSTAMQRAARMADHLYQVEAHAQQLRQRLSQLTPVAKLDQLLRAGKVTTLWYAQRLSDMGMSLEEVKDEIERVQGQSNGSEVVSLPDQWTAYQPPTWRARMNFGRRPKLTTATHSPPAHAQLKSRSQS